MRGSLVRANSESDKDENAGRNNGDGSPRFDPARERALERARARRRRVERESERDRTTDRDRTGSRSSEDAERARHRSPGPKVAAPGNGSASLGGNDGLGVASPSDVTGRGIVLALFTALLCALGYFGVVGVRADGVLAFDQTIPAPFYALTYSLLFVFTLVPRAHRGRRTLVRATTFSLLYGTLLAVAVEGVVHLGENPSIVTTDYTGLTVLALAVVVVSLAYWGVLSVAKTA